ncbi:hypothetical protein E2986_11340 [Frieseomelitta varia]|uniref:Uncharacterized protein n=1 Tax=Frieseomelitta varia TaxID=561572 RepID=A0A833W055_9HYME|nr:hypothetical protein E2986_11340 [Frieseomelitta varia]
MITHCSLLVTVPASVCTPISILLKFYSQRFAKLVTKSEQVKHSKIKQVKIQILSKMSKSLDSVSPRLVSLVSREQKDVTPKSNDCPHSDMITNVCLLTRPEQNWSLMRRARGTMGLYEEFPTTTLISTSRSLRKGIATVGKMTMNLAGGPGTPEEYQWKR